MKLYMAIEYRKPFEVKFFKQKDYAKGFLLKDATNYFRDTFKVFHVYTDSGWTPVGKIKRIKI